MKQISLIFPNQLFEFSPLLKYGCDIVIIEDSLFWGNDKYYQFKNHINKIIFLKASMCSYKEYLEKNGMIVGMMSNIAQTDVEKGNRKNESNIYNFP